MHNRELFEDCIESGDCIGLCTSRGINIKWYSVRKVRQILRSAFCVLRSASARIIYIYFTLDGMLVHCKAVPPFSHEVRWYPCLHLGGGRGCQSKVSCPSASTRTQTARSEVKRTNHNIETRRGSRINDD